MQMGLRVRYRSAGESKWKSRSIRNSLLKFTGTSSKICIVSWRKRQNADLRLEAYSIECIVRVLRYKQPFLVRSERPRYIRAYSKARMWAIGLQLAVRNRSVSISAS
jgi:hypothetical protein